MPEALFQAMHRLPVVNVVAPMAARVKFWREDHPHFSADPEGMVRKLEPLKPLVGKEALAHWMALASSGQVDDLFESVMCLHYDLCCARSMRPNYGVAVEGRAVQLPSLDPPDLAQSVRLMVASFSV